jgi:hypothetical protein
MEEKRAVQVVDALRERGVDAHVERPATYSFAVRVELEDKSYAVWDVDGARAAAPARRGLPPVPGRLPGVGR